MIKIQYCSIFVIFTCAYKNVYISKTKNKCDFI